MGRRAVRRPGWRRRGRTLRRRWRRRGRRRRRRRLGGRRRRVRCACDERGHAMPLAPASSVVANLLRAASPVRIPQALQAWHRDRTRRHSSRVRHRAKAHTNAHATARRCAARGASWGPQAEHECTPRRAHHCRAHCLARELDRTAGAKIDGDRRVRHPACHGQLDAKVRVASAAHAAGAPVWVARIDVHNSLAGALATAAGRRRVAAEQSAAIRRQHWRRKRRKRRRKRRKRRRWSWDWQDWRRRRRGRRREVAHDGR